jgi:starch synthase
MKILSVTSEIFPLIKTGGLADVTGSLPKALKGYGAHTSTLIPGYPVVMSMVKTTNPLCIFEDLLGERVALLHGRYEDLDLFILDAPALYDRPGGPYVDEFGKDHADNWKRFGVLSLAGAEIAAGLLPGWVPDVVHTHDWPSAMTSVYMRSVKQCATPTVLTVHNLAFQGKFHIGLLPYLGIPDDFYAFNNLEYFGDISFLKGGLQTADAITTVSPTYAREILTPEFGMGMAGILNARSNVLRGIVNGIDAEIWNPATDPYLVRNYDHLSIRRRRENRIALIRRFDLDDDAGPIFSAISRLTWQKGMDMLAETADQVVGNGGKLIVCGQGDLEIEHALLRVAARFPGRMAVHIGYDEETAHLLHGGSDAIVQPSRFEPCGLTQLYALRYGCVPVVSRTGGLSETIIDANDAAMSARVATGFQFHPVNAETLRLALQRCMEAYRDPRMWARLQNQGMKARFSWERSADQYASLYENLIGASRPLGFPDIRSAVF